MSRQLNVPPAQGGGLGDPQQPIAHDEGQGYVDQDAALGVFRRLGMTAPGAAAGECGGPDRRQGLGVEGRRLSLGPPEDPAQPPHHLRDAGAARLGPPRQIGALDDGRPGLPDGGHAFAVLRQADQVVAEGGLQAPGQVEPLLLGPAAKAGPGAGVGPLGVPGPGGQADLVAPGEGRAGDGNGLGQQDRGLLRCRITAIIRRLRWAWNRATYPGSSAISTSLATALARRIWRGVRQRTLSSSGLATTTARQRARLVATFSRFRL